MIRKFAVLTSVVLSASCMVLHQTQAPLYGLQYNDNPRYNFAYEVNEAHTGDIKSQHESRRGNIVLGQYSLLQPDGIQRTVDYRADDHTGFRATVDNQGRHYNGYPSFENGNNAGVTRHSNLAVALSNSRPLESYATSPLQAPAGHSSQITAISAPVAVSTSSFVQSISNEPVPVLHNTHNIWA